MNIHMCNMCRCITSADAITSISATNVAVNVLRESLTNSDSKLPGIVNLSYTDFDYVHQRLLGWQWGGEVNWWISMAFMYTRIDINCLYICTYIIFLSLYLVGMFVITSSLWVWLLSYFFHSYSHTYVHVFIFLNSK